MKCERASHSHGARGLLWISGELRSITPDPPGRGLLIGDGRSQDFRLSRVQCACLHYCVSPGGGRWVVSKGGFNVGWHLKRCPFCAKTDLSSQDLAFLDSIGLSENYLQLFYIILQITSCYFFF